MKIYLPHIHYTVYVRRFKKHPSLSHALAYTERLDNNSAVLHLPPRQTPGDLAHELIHVLRFICESRNMDFTLESEHMAYIMQYLMAQVLGYQWK